MVQPQMADIADDFDKHPGINYTDLTHLFWGKYPFKVVIKVPQKLMTIPYSDFFTKTRKFCPETGGTYSKISSTRSSISVFFQDRQMAENYIDQHHDHVSYVFRPRWAAEISIMQNDIKVRVRKNLFWNKFRWCISFTDDGTEQIDSWTEQYFAGDDPSRFYQSFSNDRRIYLVDEMDVVALKMSLSEFTASVEKAVLHSEIDSMHYCGIAA